MDGLLISHQRTQVALAFLFKMAPTPQNWQWKFMTHWQDEAPLKGEHISIFLLPRLMRLCFILGKYPVHLESVFCTNMILNNEATALTYRPFSLTGKEDLNERNTNLFSGFLD